MDPVAIVALTIAIALLAGALAWFGPRRRHWQTHGGDKTRSHRPEEPGDSSTGDG